MSHGTPAVIGHGVTVQPSQMCEHGMRRLWVHFSDTDDHPNIPTCQTCDGPEAWTVESLSPLTLSPSIEVRGQGLPPRLHSRRKVGASMKRLAILLAAVALFAGISVAHAGESPPVNAPRVSESLFPPPNTRYIAYIDFNQVIPQVQSTGVLTWKAVDAFGWPGWRQVVAQSMDTGSPYAGSMGNILSYSITVREASGGELADVQLNAVATGFLEGKCGAGFATACAYLFDPRPSNTYYKAAAMITWPFTSNAHVICHEVCGHSVSHACDQYIGGCPPTDGQPFQCTSNPDTNMDCYNAARTMQPYDVVTYEGAYMPPAFERCIENAAAACVGMDPVAGAVWWCNRDGRSLVVSVAYDDDVQGDGYWVKSFTGDPAARFPKLLNDGFPNFAETNVPGAGRCQGTTVERPPPGVVRCVYLLMDNYATTRARQYWALAGCF